MTAHTTFAPSAVTLPLDAEKRHRRIIMGASLCGTALTIALAAYGANYYTLSQAQRPFSPRHHILKPSGVVGLNMGLLGVLLFCAIFLYPLRKRWAWLRTLGNSRHWLDYHVVLGIAAPVCIAFHSSFKFSGLAGIAFWVMVAVAVSGFVGRYLYSQVLRRVAEAELSLKVFRQVLAHQKMIAPADLKPLLHVPSAQEVARWPILVALGYMITSDLARPFSIARLRLRGMGIGHAILSLGGLLPVRNAQLEWVIGLARQQALLSRRVVLLSHAQRVFQLWHVIHRPFSYAFVLLALLHIVVAMLLGFI
jgi:hypothetical protein